MFFFSKIYDNNSDRSVWNFLQGKYKIIVLSEVSDINIINRKCYKRNILNELYSKRRLGKEFI